MEQNEFSRDPIPGYEQAVANWKPPGVFVPQAGEKTLKLVGIVAKREFVYDDQHYLQIQPGYEIIGSPDEDDIGFQFRKFGMIHNMLSTFRRKSSEILDLIICSGLSLQQYNNASMMQALERMIATPLPFKAYCGWSAFCVPCRNDYLLAKMDSELGDLKDKERLAKAKVLAKAYDDNPKNRKNKIYDEANRRATDGLPKRYNEFPVDPKNSKLRIPEVRCKKDHNVIAGLEVVRLIPIK